MRSGRAGQALVEFALAVSVFMLLVVGTFDLARAYISYTVLSNVAREATRYGAANAVPCSPDTTCTCPRPCASPAAWQTKSIQAGQNLAVGIDFDPASQPFPTLSPQNGLTYVSVNFSYQFHPLTPLVAAVLGNPINMTVSTSALVG